MLIVYHSGPSQYTVRFVEKLGLRALRIPTAITEETPELLVHEPYILITPTYATTKRVVPPQVVRFLSVEENRRHIQAVIGGGNRNFGKDFCAAAFAVARKCQVPVLHLYELLGTPEDVAAVREKIAIFSSVSAGEEPKHLGA